MSLKTVLICDDPTARAALEQLLARQQSLTLVDTVPASQSAAKIQEALPEVVWIELSPAPVRGLSILAEQRERHPDLSFLVSYEKPDPELMRTAYRLGASDFLDPSSWESDLESSVKSIQSLNTFKSGSEQRSKVNAAASTDGEQTLKTLLVCDGAKEKKQAIEKLVKGHKRLYLCGTISTARALERVRILSPKLVWIELSPDEDRALKLLADVRKKFPSLDVFVSYDALDARLIRACYQLGARDYLDVERWQTDLPAAIQNIAPLRKSSNGATVVLVAVLSTLAAVIWWLLNH